MRGPFGQDGFLTGYPQASNGVQVNLRDDLRDDLPGGDNGPLNLDFAPDSDTSCLYCDFFDSSLDVGQSYSDVDGAFTLRVDSVGDDFTATVTVTIPDRTPPEVVKAPTASFSSPIGTSRIPVAVGWAAIDPSGVCRYDLQESVDGGGFAAVALAAVTDTAAERSQSDGHRYRVRATDCAGNASAWTSGPSQVLDVRDQNEPGTSYAGAWALQQVAGAWRGSLRHAEVPGRSLTCRFSGRNVAFVAATGPDRGRARIYVDGVLARTVDLHAASPRLRRVVYQRRWIGDGAHSLKVVVAAGTPDRPRVDADAFLRLAG